MYINKKTKRINKTLILPSLVSCTEEKYKVNFVNYFEVKDHFLIDSTNYIFWGERIWN